MLDNNGNEIGKVGSQSEYPHYCLFIKDDSQLITNSCHFYNGMTIGVDSNKLDGINIKAWEDSDEYIYLDEEMRVYAGVATKNYYT